MVVACGRHRNGEAALWGGGARGHNHGEARGPFAARSVHHPEGRTVTRDKATSGGKGLRKATAAARVRVLQRGRQAALGTLVTGLAHEILTTRRPSWCSVFDLLDSTPPWRAAR